MVKRSSSIDEYNNKNKNNTLFYDDSSLVNESNIFSRAFLLSMQFNIKLCNALAESYPIYLSTISEYNQSWKNLSELDKILRSRFRKFLDEKFREESFVNTLSDTIASYSELAKITGLGKIYQYLSNIFSVWNNNFVEPIRDTLYRTPSQ